MPTDAASPCWSENRKHHTLQLQRLHFSAFHSFITCKLNVKEDGLEQLKCQVHAKTGIPPDAQQFISGTKLVTSSTDIKGDSTLTLEIKLVGGSNCDICYGRLYSVEWTSGMEWWNGILELWNALFHTSSE